jgi:hypothetical protein
MPAGAVPDAAMIAAPDAVAAATYNDPAASNCPATVKARSATVNAGAMEADGSAPKGTRMSSVPSAAATWTGGRISRHGYCGEHGCCGQSSDGRS